MNDSKQFWQVQTNSRHRSEDTEFFRTKAEEHVSFVSQAERRLSCVDLGCGDGKLALYLSEHLNIEVGIDYSESMLEQAKQTLASTKIRLLCADIFEYLPASAHEVWITTGALNQYLTPERLLDFLDVFIANPTAHSLYLFDCVDHLRYSLLPFGIKYQLPSRRAKRSFVRRLASRAFVASRRAMVGGAIATGVYARSWRRLRTGMGYGYLPAFWFEAGVRRKLEVSIVSSKAYEYRYHVALRKTPI
jgi:SAM-dependent methyltransferase